MILYGSNSRTVSGVKEDKSSIIEINDQYQYKEDKEILSMLGKIGYDTRGVKAEDLKFTGERIDSMDREKYLKLKRWLRR